MGGQGGKGCQGTCIKDHEQSQRGVGSKVGGVGMAGVGVRSRGKMETTVLEQQF